MKTLALGAVAILLLGGIGNTVSEETEEPSLRFVYDPGLELEQAVAHYGTFQTAWLTDSEADALAEQGVATEVIELSVKRGDWVIDGSDAAIPADLRDDDAMVRIVQFVGPVKSEWRTQLYDTVDRVYDVIPHFAYLVRMDAATEKDVASWDEVHFVGAYHPAYKLSHELPGHGKTDVTILTFPDQPLPGVVTQLTALGVDVNSYTDTFHRDGIIKATVDVADLQDLIALDEVSWIEPAYGEITLDNAEASAITQTGTLTTYRVHEEGVDGSSQVISVCDTGVATDSFGPNLGDIRTARMRHEMYDDEAFPPVFWNTHLPEPLNVHRKVERFYGPHLPDDPLGPSNTPGDFGDTYGHGTHVAGTIAGSIPPYDERVEQDGIAYNAKLAICDIHGPSFYIANDYTEYWEPAYEVGARINSNSWGQGHTSSYTMPARMHDDYTWENPDFLILRSAGNAGQWNIRISAVAKSAMGIGATINGFGMEDMASFSSRGPAADGRIKPNVVAPGACLNSAGLGSSGYRCLSGTSMSTPATAGAAGLVRDYFEKGYYPSGSATSGDELAPSSSLVRAALQISGKQITGSGAGTEIPNRDQGWGRVLLDDVLHFDGDSRTLFVDDEDTGLETGDTETYTLDVAAGEPLRVMAAWNDYAAVAGANPAIVNDLDLEVSGPDGTHIGNAFVNSETPPNQGNPDRINVEEAVYVNNPTPGTYTVTIRGANVPEGPQPYALVAVHG